MFFTYLRRELSNRRKQSVIIAIGMAVAIALVMIVNAVAAGVSDAQDDVLDSVYGVGTDITVTQAGEPGGRGPGRFDVGSDDGEASDDGGSRSFDQDQLAVARGTASFDASALDTVAGIEHVAGTTGTLVLSNTSFSGEVPDFGQMQGGQGGGPGGGDAQSAPTGGADGAGGSAFSIDAFTVTGVDPAADAVGPLTAVEVSDGRGLETADNTSGDDGAAGTVAVLDSTYAESADLAVGDTVTVGGTDLDVVGVVSSTSGEGVSTGSDVYVPLALAQSLADLDGQVSNVYVQADSSEHVDAISDAISAALPDVSVSTQADLASSVTGSLSTASDLVSTLGLWLSVIVLAAAFGIAILFTVSGVTRRTRELGTLKAIGWPNGRVVGQVAGESLVQGLIGGVAGLALGLVGIGVINALGITLSGATGTGGFTFGGPGGFGGAGGAGADAGAGPGAAGGGPGGGGGGGPFGGAADAAQSAVDVALHAPVSVTVIVVAIGLAVLGGLLAGLVGGRRAARLRPAEALRSVA
ncbi:FtsX-like permease family protein [Sediminihabitans luteus]|uniref:FtsX-like permease family protein n=1 Tax=Sediminihabitans luteus TaxID=1138585 RepID=A0A2M9CD74_9CELL|nr:ABC transporter permease [Sediminihabitans luteus]PJJ69886.1 FtsX-like permease family protein [Sediminihabitans luteus]GII99205.1 membrane protein [Sediminihabitans luteus]